MSNIIKGNHIGQFMPPAKVVHMAGRKVGREAIQKGGEYLAKEAIKKSGRQIGKQIVKVAANPWFVVGDVVELGVEAMTDNKVAAKGSSLAVYVGAGFVTTGPLGACIGAGCWFVGQCVGALIESVA